MDNKENRAGMIVLKFGGTSVQNAEMMDATLSIVEGSWTGRPSSSLPPCPR